MTSKSEDKIRKSGQSIETLVKLKDEDWSTTPEFIYGGPFITKGTTSPFMNTATPINLQLQGTFKKSFAYYSLKDRLPVIITKIIDSLSRGGAKGKGSDEDVRNYIQYLTELKSDLITNKQYKLLTVDTPEAKRWNQWIEDSPNQYYFTNTWVFTECYVYRRIREGCELNKGLINFDPFEEQKAKSFSNSLEPMCVVAEKVITMLDPSEKDKRKADFIMLLKICLWSNKCDLSLSMGEEVTLKNEGVPKSPSKDLVDPIQMIIDLKDKILVDDSSKIVDQVVSRSEAILKIMDEPAAPTENPEDNPTPEGEEPPKPKSCPAKVTKPLNLMFDIVCDNAGYELFSDLCLAHFLISQKIANKIRFHVKSIPWFVSDVTPKDFDFVINSCVNGCFEKVVKVEPKPAASEGQPPEEEAPRVINADALKLLGQTWANFVADGTFVVLCDDFWTSPHTFKDMKKIQPYLYRDLQFAVAVLFKGDLNYRKLLGERNCNPSLGFEPALQGFLPAPVIALRTVKADLICGLPKGKWEQLNKIDPKWMEKGDYGVIQFCGKCEPLKVFDRPCALYGDTCRGIKCF
ncbi:unnamed protein product [Leptidea sinapis]|uniref:Sugar phosphate phosphatase n=1 Tax=Leptidea sinapis TaxID=189913 RepID=A0A5E4QU20_9NEOP|nr:unnamed protein product [Leptidea sinapis]